MDTLTNQPDEPAAAPRRPRRTGLLAAAVVAGLVAGATGVALADDGSTASGTPSSTASPRDGYGPGGGQGHGAKGFRDRGPGGRHGIGPMGAMGLMGLHGALHGELVVPKAGGGYQTVLVQRGEATAVSGTSITVRSEDGFTRTYAVTGDTLVNAGRDGITSVAEGSKVAVQGVKSGERVNAVHVADLSRLQKMRDRFRAPTPAPTSTTTSPGSGA